MRRIRNSKTKKTYDTLSAAAQDAGVPYNTFAMRLKNGWTVNDAMTTPVRVWGGARRKKARRR